MISSRCTKAAFLAAIIAAAPVVAQGEPHDPLPSEAYVPETGKTAPGSYDLAIDNNMDVIGQFMHQQAGDPASGVMAEPEGWIEWSMNALAASAENAGIWIAARSDHAATASQDAYEWLSASTSFITTAAYGATEWISETSEDIAESVEETTDWIASETTTAAHAATGTVNEALDGLWIMEDWSEEFVEEVKKKLQEDKTSKFAMLVSESGFVLTNVVVGVGMIPSLDVEFRHERDLSPEELAAFKKKVTDYADKAGGLMGYLETVLLRNLARAGQLSGGLRIGELHVDLFPFPGLALLFDPFHVEKERDQMLFSADEFARTHVSEIDALEQRIDKLEAELAALRGPVSSQ
jgi:hypothetical protein